MKLLLFACVLLFAGYMYMTPAAPPAHATTTASGAGEPLVTVAPTPTTAPTPAQTGPQRVQFAIGTYGTSLEGVGRAEYLLWAARGQTMRIVTQADAAYSMTGPDGATVGFADGAALLPANGDYTLTVDAGSSRFMFSVDIR